MATSSFGATVSPEVTAPAGLTNGDLIVIGLLTATTNTGDETPAGWTLLSLENGGLDSTLFVLYKIASGEGATWTLTNLFVANEQGAAFAAAYSGVDQSTPLDVAEVSGDLGETEGADTGPITPTNNNCMIVSICGGDATEAISGTPDGAPACTERVDYCRPTYFEWIYMQEHLQTDATEEAHTITPSISETIPFKILAFRPASGNGGGSIVPLLISQRRRRI